MDPQITRGFTTGQDHVLPTRSNRNHSLTASFSIVTPLDPHQAHGNTFLGGNSRDSVLPRLVGLGVSAFRAHAANFVQSSSRVRNLSPARLSSPSINHQETYLPLSRSSRQPRSPVSSFLLPFFEHHSCREWGLVQRGESTIFRRRVDGQFFKRNLN